MISGISSVDSVFWTIFWQSTLFLLIGLIISFVIRNHSARAHRILLLSIIASVFVPAMTILVKHLGLGIFEAKIETFKLIEQEPVLENPIEPYVFAPTEMSLQPEFANVETPLLPEPEEEIAEAQSIFKTFVIQNWRSILLFGWIAISVILTFRLLVTFLLGVRLLNRAEPLESKRITNALQHAKEKLAIRKDVRLYGSRKIKSPVIWCWRVKPVLVVPKDAEQFHERIDWTGVLCHELAHWKRHDHICGLIAELAACILPWQILLWLTKTRLINLSEHACDDWVIATGKTGTDYAESLLDMTPGGQMAFVPAVVRDKNGLAQRVQRILKDSCGNPRTGLLWAITVCIITCSIAITIAFAQTRAGNNIGDNFEILKIDSLPDGWQLSYDNGIVSEGRGYWPANISNDLAYINIIPTPANEYDESWKDEKLELQILSKENELINTITFENGQENKPAILAPGQFNIIYKRSKRESESSAFVTVENMEFPFALIRPGIYILKFRPQNESTETIESGTYPSAICTGMVIDENGNPIKETQVAAYETFFDKAGNISLRFISETMSTDGNFKFEAAPTVTKNRSQGGIIVAKKEGLAIGWSHWPLYGEQNVNVTLSKPVKMLGQVTDDKNNPIPNAEVRAVLFEDKKSDDEQTKWLPGVEPLNWLTVHTNDNGLFEFDNIPGNVSSGFLASASGFGTMYSCEPDGDGGFKNIKYAAGTTDIKMILSAEAIIEGKVIDEKSGEALANETLSIIPYFTPTFFERYLCTTKEDGTFRVNGLRDGKYIIRRAGYSSYRIDIAAESGKTTSDVVIELPRDIPITETANNRIDNDENQINETSKPVNPERQSTSSNNILYCYNLPGTWSLHYDKDFKQSSANIANNLSCLEILPKSTDEKEESKKNENYKFRFFSLDGIVMGNIPITELSHLNRKVFQPGRYLLEYERQYGESGKNYRINSDQLVLDLSKPGMYQLQFDPELGNCEISGSAGGCYAVNYELVGVKDFPVRGFAYINREKEYQLKGLPSGIYRISAVSQQDSGNVVVTQTQVTIEKDSKVTLDIKPQPEGNCSLSGSILGKNNTYSVGNPTNPTQMKGQWIVLLRNQLAGEVTTMYAYEAVTMDSKYVIRGSGNIKQETPEKANFKIEGIAPGGYNVTVIENPFNENIKIRQQSKRINIRKGEDAVLDFDFENEYSAEQKETTNSESILNSSQNPQSLKKQKISGEQSESGNLVLIETQIVQASDKFLKEVGLDSKSLQASDKWSKYHIENHIEPNCFLLDTSGTDILYKAMESRKDVSSLRYATQVFNEAGEMLNSFSPTGDRVIYYNPQLSKDGKSAKLNLALSKYLIEKPQTILDTDLIIIGQSNTVTVNQVSTPNTFIPSNSTLLILSGKVISKHTKYSPGVPVLKDLPLIGEAFNNLIAFDFENEHKIVIQRHGVPVLRDVPLIGELFDNPTYIKTKLNQLFLIKLHILSKEDAEKFLSEQSRQPIILKP